MWLNRAAALPVAPSALADTARGVGLLVIGAAGLMIASAAILFALRRTTIVPHRHASALIVVGPYRFTRNPMYVGLTALCVGAALVVNTSWPLLLVIAPLWLLHAKTIPFEENTMERAFGDDYREYCRRVRRWL
jgi:protein-S-isoprenylcysteine O-methyltransferase Ste14